MLLLGFKVRGIRIGRCSLEKEIVHDWKRTVAEIVTRKWNKSRTTHVFYHTIAIPAGGGTVRITFPEVCRLWNSGSIRGCQCFSPQSHLQPEALLTTGKTKTKQKEHRKKKLNFPLKNRKSKTGIRFSNNQQ